MAYPLSLSRRVFLGLCGGIAARTTLADTAPLSHGKKTLRAGIAKIDISPEPGISIAGHMQDRKATHVHDPLYVRCLALDNGETRLALAMVDNCLILQRVCDMAKAGVYDRIGIETSHVLIAATHTHTAPCVTPIFQSEPDPAYQRLLTESITEAIVEAFAHLEPAQIGWGEGTVADEVHNRRWHMKPEGISLNPFGHKTDQVRMNPPRQDDTMVKPAGPTDPSVPFLAVQRPDGSPLCIMANYALHYVGGTEAGAISADYFGCFAQALEATLSEEAKGMPVMAMLSNGSSGDVNNINFTAPALHREPYEQMQMVADTVAREVYHQYRELTFQDWAPLAAVVSKPLLGVRLPEADDVTQAREIVEAADSPEMQSLQEIYARETLLLSAYPEKVTVPLQAMRLGDMAITGIPCEVFAEIGLAMKAGCKLPHLMPVELANGYNGYLPTAEQHGWGGYETWRARSSYLEVDAARHIQDELERLLRLIA